MHPVSQRWSGVAAGREHLANVSPWLRFPARSSFGRRARRRPQLPRRRHRRAGCL